ELWNAARFALGHFEGMSFRPRSLAELRAEDRWILSRLSKAISATTRFLDAYNPSAAIGGLREFFWSDLCDWYIELVKPRMSNAAAANLARQVLALALDPRLRLLRPPLPAVPAALS